MGGNNGSLSAGGSRTGRAQSKDDSAPSPQVLMPPEHFHIIAVPVLDAAGSSDPDPTGKDSQASGANCTNPFALPFRYGMLAS